MRPVVQAGQFGTPGIRIPPGQKEWPRRSGAKCTGHQLAEGGSYAAGQCGNSGHGGWFLGGKHSVPECCRGATARYSYAVPPGKGARQIPVQPKAPKPHRNPPNSPTAHPRTQPIVSGPSPRPIAGTRVPN